MTVSTEDAVPRHLKALQAFEKERIDQIEHVSQYTPCWMNLN